MPSSGTTQLTESTYRPTPAVFAGIIGLDLFGRVSVAP